MDGQADGELVNVPEVLPGYKRPSPPKWKKRDVFDPEKMLVVDEKATQVTITADTTYQELVSQLTNGLKTDLQKVRSIFTWLGKQDIDGGVYPKLTDARTPKGFMKLMQNAKGTYSEFFALLCRAAKLQCVIVRGFCKSAAYEVGEQDISDLQVTWNAVHVGGSWQIVHPMWAFTGVIGHNTGRWTKIEAEGKGTRETSKAEQGINVRRVNEDYFLPQPDEFIAKCIAEKKEWQLLKKPWDIRKFCNVPQFQMDYFTSDYKLTSQQKAILVSVDGKTEVEFTEKGGSAPNLSYELFFDEEQSEEKLPSGIELPRTVFFETNQNKLRLIVRFHVVGIYKLSILATTTLVTFKLEAREKSKNKNMLPVNPPIGFGFGHTAKNLGLIAPSHTSGVVVTQRDTVEEFTFRMTKITQIIARLRHVSTDSNELSPYIKKAIKGKDVSIKVTMPNDCCEDEYALQVYTKEEKDEYNVLNYLLTSSKEDFEKSSEMRRKVATQRKMEEDKIRRNLQIALLNMKLDQLQRSVKAFEAANLQDTDGNYRKAKALLRKLKKEDETNKEIHHLKQSLRRAMKGKDLGELEEAIVKAESSNHSELEEMIKAAKYLLMELQMQEVDKARATDLRLRLKEATEDKIIDELEEAINEFEKAKLQNKGDLRKAKLVLCQLYEKDAEEAISREDLDGLQAVLVDTEKSVIAKDLQQSDVIARAVGYLQQKKRIKGKLSNILDLSTSTVAEIHGYKNPKPVTQDIMRATFILLGHHPKDVQRWNNIQKYLKPSGDVLKKIKTVKMQSIHDNTVKWASQLLGKYTTDDVREVSAGVASFYRWSSNMIQERSMKK